MMGIKTLLLIFLFATQGTMLATGRHPRGHLVGAPVNISRDDPELQKIALIGAASYNNQSNDAFLFKPSAIDSAQRQVVEGLEYNIHFKMSRTVCRKREIINNLNSCALQPAGPLHQTVCCYLEVWMVSWEKKTAIQVFHCKDETSQ